MLMQGLTTLSAAYVRRLQLAADTAVAVLSVSLSAALQSKGNSEFWVMPKAVWFLALVAVAAFSVNAVSGLHRIKLVMFNARDIARIVGAASVNSVVCLGAGYAFSVPHTLPIAIAFFLAFFSLSVGMRIIAIAVLSYLRDRRLTREPVAIFGAGGSGIQLASALRQSSDIRPIFFVDDNPNLQGMAVGGLPVHSAASMIVALNKSRVKTVFVALPERASDRRAQVAEILAANDIKVRILPPFADLLVGRGNDTMFRTVAPDEILGRAAVELDVPEIGKSYAGRVVMVTGAGGSIGAELCRQLLDCRPARIVLFDQCEFNLYDVDRRLRLRAKHANVGVSSYLGSVTDPVRVRQVLAAEAVDIVLHAAAYKHVPLVEENEIEGARNNVIGTKVVADAAIEARVERFILISTDKAVRPSNIMGATKRMAEFVVQDEQALWSCTKFSIVRFGNVLGSSGSVLPLFQSQLDAGGPLTVTHPTASRYFMTLTEATRLVLLAGAYADGGDVFVLDMGRPQTIMDIARRVVELSGRTIRDRSLGLGGDIEIQITGLRPGEKLHEERLTDLQTLHATPSEKIMRMVEGPRRCSDISNMLIELNAAINAANAEHVRKIIRERVDGYHTQNHVEASRADEVAA